MNFKQTFKNKKVFVTGHTGFKGSWLVLWLETLGATVKGYALKPNTNPSLFESLSKQLKCESVLADIRNKERLTKEVESFQPDFIFHLAAQPLVRESYEIPLETFEVNAIGTANLLNAVRDLKKACTVVVITTDKVYHNNEWHHPYRESDRLGGYDPYSASKAATEIVVDSFRSSFFNPNDYSKHKKAIATARAGNVIGGGDFAKDRIVPDIFRALSKNEKIEVRNPNAVRPWQHVLDCLNGYLMLVDGLLDGTVSGGPWNFGPVSSSMRTVAEAASMAAEKWGHKATWVEALGNHPHEATILSLDANKARSALGWRDYLTFKESVAWTVEWAQSVQSGTSPLAAALEQIQDFEVRRAVAVQAGVSA